ncbi:hypothetical protein NPIL_265361 [Nephila pilipes]|uniref:Uncharacterized protein n=1 Tax=Nephila pilipes TaxID=299642 RepID=A0A8X6U652_NEPPI|nr:hypothetical protein NPIL_265361 [Nephila pilipes]
MQRYSEPDIVANSLLLELFLQQLPPSVQSILEDFQTLTAQKAADCILEAIPVQVSAVSNSAASTDVSEKSELHREHKTFTLRNKRTMTIEKLFSKSLIFSSPAQMPCCTGSVLFGLVSSKILYCTFSSGF